MLARAHAAAAAAAGLERRDAPPRETRNVCCIRVALRASASLARSPRRPQAMAALKAAAAGKGPFGGTGLKHSK